jgi:hypothetical protein
MSSAEVCCGSAGVSSGRMPLDGMHASSSGTVIIARRERPWTPVTE